MTWALDEGPQRYEAAGGPSPFSASLRAQADGAAVLFADVEPALRDSKRLAWLLPVIDGTSGPEAKRRNDCLVAGVRIGLSGVALVDWAMEGCPP